MPDEKYPAQEKTTYFGTAPSGYLAYEPYKEGATRLKDLPTKEQEKLITTTSDERVMQQALGSAFLYPMLLENPNLTLPIIKQLIRRLPGEREKFLERAKTDSDVREALILSLRLQPSHTLFFGLMKFPNLSASELDQLADAIGSSSSDYALALIRHPNIDPETAARLKKSLPITFYRKENRVAGTTGWITANGDFVSTAGREHYSAVLDNPTIFGLPKDFTSLPEVKKLIQHNKFLQLIPWILEKTHAIRVVGLVKGSLWLQVHKFEDIKNAETFIFNHLSELKDIRVDAASQYYFADAEEFKMNGFDAFQKAPGSVVFGSKTDSELEKFPSNATYSKDQLLTYPEDDLLGREVDIKAKVDIKTIREQAERMAPVAPTRMSLFKALKQAFPEAEKEIHQVMRDLINEKRANFGFFDGPVDIGKNPTGDFPSVSWLPSGQEDASVDSNVRAAGQAPKPLTNANMSKLVPLFVDSTEPDSHMCGSCMFRVGKNQCTIVKGNIDFKKGTCDYWAEGKASTEKQIADMQMTYETAGYGETPNPEFKVNCGSCVFFKDDFCKLWHGSVKAAQCCMAYQNPEVKAPSTNTTSSLQATIKHPLTVEQQQEVISQTSPAYNIALSYFDQAVQQQQGSIRALNYALSETKKLKLGVDKKILVRLIRKYLPKDIVE